MLNPMLFNKLKEVFGEVRIANENIEMQCMRRQNDDGTFKNTKVVSGEQYRVCCPFCDDTHLQRFRLYISYTWGLDKEKQFPGTQMVICQNERCDQNQDTSDPYRRNPKRYLQQVLKQYFDLAKGGAIQLRVRSVDLEVIEPLPFPNADWVTPVNELRSGHQAIMYLKNDRKFDPVVLYEKYGVVYCHEYPVMRAGKDYSFLGGRVFIPCGDIGWQARTLSPVAKLKYFTCPGWQKAQHVYNIKNARACGTRFALAFEGVTDVWRLDGPGLCTYGKSISNAQIDEIAANWDTVLLMYDPDAQKETSEFKGVRRIMNQFSKKVENVINILPPGNKDPGACTHDLLWSTIEKQAARAGLDFVKRV
jgi:hypothetical protein